MKHWARAQLGLERAEDRLQVREHDVGAPQPQPVPVGLFAAQAVDARMGEQGAFDRALSPVEGLG
jgi:hypothetical protein